MTDDELDRLLRAARPDTDADHGFTGSSTGQEALAAIRVGANAPAGRPARRALRRLRPYRLGVGLTAAAAAVIGVGLALPGPSGPDAPLGAPPTDAALRPLGATPPRMTLAAYDSCAAMLDALRKHTAAQVTAYGLPYDGRFYASGRMARVALDDTVPTSAAAGAAKAPVHSGTNIQELGADEPDIIKNDGRRIVTVSNGVLRVVDAASRTITGTLDLRMYAGAGTAQLLLSGNRVLVLLSDQGAYAYRGMVGGPVAGAGPGSTFLLVDVSARPKVLDTLRADGGYVDARLVDGIARVVVDNTPRLSFPVPVGNRTQKERIAANRKIVEQAPLGAWLPSYQTSVGGASITHSVPCDHVSHPSHYTGDSLVTVYSLDPATSLDDPHPISVAADGSTVYASTSDLYVASSDGAATDLHRFYLGTPGAPRYVGSGRVPGHLLDSYSLSAYGDWLRVVTTSAARETSLYVLDADTLRRRGSVGGLGIGEDLHAVRFLGPLAYAVTFESIDPLYVLDLHDPAHPRRAGELKVPGYSDYLHPTDDGRLLGVGQDVNGQQQVTGLQVSLFDVADAAAPTRLDVLVRRHAPSRTAIDPHAFLYWPATRTAVIPLDSWQPGDSGAALVVHVGRDGLRTVGTVRNPAVATANGYDTGIERTLVVGGDLWTMSGSGLRVSDLHSLARRAWIPFQ